MEFWQTVSSRRKVEFGRKKVICHLVLDVAVVSHCSWGIALTANCNLHRKYTKYKIKDTYNKGLISNIWYFPLQICLICERKGEPGRQRAVLSGHSPGRRRFCYREHPAKQVFYNVFHSPEIASTPPVTHQVILSGKYFGSLEVWEIWKLGNLEVWTWSVESEGGFGWKFCCWTHIQ